MLLQTIKQNIMAICNSKLVQKQSTLNKKVFFWQILVYKSKNKNLLVSVKKKFTKEYLKFNKKKSISIIQVN